MTKEKILSEINQYAYNIEAQAGNEEKVVDWDDVKRIIPIVMEEYDRDLLTKFATWQMEGKIYINEDVDSFLESLSASPKKKKL